MDKEGTELSRQPPQGDKYAREKLFLAEQATEGGLKVLPGTKWGFHYKKDIEVRNQIVSDLLSGKVKPLEAAADLKPDALLYDAKDIEEQGLSSVMGRVRDVSAQVAYYDYPKFAQFLLEMQGTGISPEVVQTLYDGLAQQRVRKKVLDAYGYTGKKQMEDALKIEAEATMQQIDSLPKLEKVLAGLKLNWMAEDLQIVRSEQRDQTLSKFSPAEKELYRQLKDAYTKYVKKGGEETYAELVKKVKEQIPRIQEEPEKDESAEKLEKELKKYEDEAVPPGTTGDPGIPPEDSDEYHTPPVNPWESEGKLSAEPYFEITPSGSSTEPLIGYYASGRKSHYDIDRETWSKRKQPVPYNANISGSERQTISATVNSGTKSIPIPNGYGLDVSSIKFKGDVPEILRDQNGCFYVKTNGVSTFSLDFLKENPIFIGVPIAEDVLPIHKGLLSADTEKILAGLKGGDLEKAEQLRQYLLSKHFYPGDGNLRMAQALQLKLRSESTGDNYIQNLDKSEYLECYSANTLFIAMLRKAGISSRLVIGHHVESAKDGKASINSTTGHAWTEVWDGNSWRRMDATPNPKQQKKDQDQNESSPSQEAQDEGIERPKDRAQGKQDQGQPQSGGGGQQMGEASDQDIAQGESQLNNAQQLYQQMEQQKQSLDQRAKDAKSFKELKDLQEETLDSELFDDMKKDLQDKLRAKEEQMKDEIKQNLEEMEKDGFLDEKRQSEIAEQLEKAQLEELDKIRQQIERENSLFNEYQGVKEEIMPLVDQWFDYFAERLPRQEEVEADEDSLTRQGSFNRHSIMKPRNLLFGTVKNPRVIKPSIKPKFLASVMVDVSGSMGRDKTLTQVDLTKIHNARKLLVFYNELFSKIGDEFGFIRYANNIFSDRVREVKAYDQEYDSPTRYYWEDGSRSTIKVRLMQSLQAEGDTDMLPAIQKAAKDLNEETFEYPDYASAFYFVGDGRDMFGNAERIKEFLQLADSEQGLGEHMLSAIMLGDESQRKELADIFGDDHTTVAPDFETLIEQSMYKFDEDIGDYLRDKTM